MRFAFSLPTLSLALVLTVGVSHAEELIKNGDFTAGKSGWSGNGQIVHLNAEGKEVEKESAGKPVMAVALSKSAFTDISQRIRTGRDASTLRATVTVSASEDFWMDASSNRFSDVNWKPGSTYYWSAWVNPKAPIVLAVKAPQNLYRMGDLSAGERGKTLSADWDLGNKGTSGQLTIIFPPGDGTVYVHAVTAN